MTEPQKLMPGSTTGPSYLLIGRRGDIALGIKMLGVVPDPGGNPGRAYVACRLRSAPYGQDLEHSEQDDNVVSLADKGLTFESAWPGIKFTKSSSQRASTIVGFFVRGNLRVDAVALLKEVLEGGHIEKLVSFLAEAAGAQHLVLRQGVVVSWAKSEIQPMLDAHQKKLAAHKEFDETAEKLIGVAGFQAEQLKALYTAMKPDEDPDAADADEAKIVKKPKHEPGEFGTEENPD